MEVAELDVDELEWVEEEDDWTEADPEVVDVVDFEVVAVEFDTPVAEEAGVDEAEEAQETAVGTWMPLAAQSWSANVMVARARSMRRSTTGA